MNALLRKLALAKGGRKGGRKEEGKTWVKCVFPSLHFCWCVKLVELIRSQILGAPHLRHVNILKIYILRIIYFIFEGISPSFASFSYAIAFIIIIMIIMVDIPLCVFLNRGKKGISPWLNHHYLYISLHFLKCISLSLKKVHRYCITYIWMHGWITAFSSKNEGLKRSDPQLFFHPPYSSLFRKNFLVPFS